MKRKLDRIEVAGVNRSRDKSLSVVMRSQEAVVDQNLKELFEKIQH